MDTNVKVEATDERIFRRMLAITTLNEIQHKLSDAMAAIQLVEDTEISGLSFRQAEPLNHFLRLAVKQIGHAMDRVELLRQQREQNY